MANTAEPSQVVHLTQEHMARLRCFVRNPKFAQVLPAQVTSTQVCSIQGCYCSQAQVAVLLQARANEKPIGCSSLSCRSSCPWRPSQITRSSFQKPQRPARHSVATPTLPLYRTITSPYVLSLVVLRRRSSIYLMWQLRYI